jgi:hypothetical protein
MIMKRLLCLSKILIILNKQSNSSVITNFLQLYHSRVSVSLNPNNVHATIQFKHSSKQYHKICHQLWITKDLIKLVMGLGYKKLLFFFWIQRALRIREHTSFSFASIIHSLSLSPFWDMVRFFFWHLVYFFSFHFHVFQYMIFSFSFLFMVSIFLFHLHSPFQPLFKITFKLFLSFNLLLPNFEFFTTLIWITIALLSLD